MDSRNVNGDGFGVGWYSDSDSEPALYRSVEPAWHDRNMRDLSKHISSSTIFAHVRAATGVLPVQQTNCHPFRYGNWLWMHNGSIREFFKVKRDLMMAIAPHLYPFVEGSTDTECFFYLALTFGLMDNPPEAVARAVGFIEKVGYSHGVEAPIVMTVATTDGSGKIWCFRYSSERASRSLFYSTDANILQRMYPDDENIKWFAPDSRFVVSEPLGDLEGAWNAVPESTCVTVTGNHIEMTPFKPLAPKSPASSPMSSPSLANMQPSGDVSSETTRKQFTVPA
jgi:predicted glutamine amidotransferase